MKPCAILKLDFPTTFTQQMHSLVRKSSFSKAQGLHETGPWCYVTERHRDRVTAGPSAMTDRTPRRPCASWWQQAAARASPLRFLMNSVSFMRRSALMLLLCRSVLSMMMAYASRKMLLQLRNCFAWSRLHSQYRSANACNTPPPPPPLDAV